MKTCECIETLEAKGLKLTTMYRNDDNRQPVYAVPTAFELPGGKNQVVPIEMTHCPFCGKRLKETKNG